MRLPAAVLLSATAFWCAQPFYEDRSDLLYYLDSRGRRRPVNNERDWRERRGHILGGMQLAMGPLPEKSRAPLAVEVIEETRFEKFTRKKITYLAEGSDRVPAYLLIPHERKARAPAMLCLHQTTKTGKAEPAGMGPNTNLHYAKELAERGFVTLAPDYPNFGDYRVDAYAMGYASATMKGIVNHRRAVDLLASMPEVDASRLGVIGHSLGGHNSLFVAAFEPRLRVVVSSCGFNSFAKYYGGNLKGWSHKGYMPRIAETFGMSPAKMPFDFTEVLGALAPRAVFVNAPVNDANFEVSGVRDCERTARAVYDKVYGASQRLVLEYPEAAHDFPPEVRERAYRFIEAALK